MKVKICGITNLEDALAAIECGADLLGFNFYPPSPRYILPQDCASISAALSQYRPPLVLVGVFVNLPVEQVQAIMRQCRLDLAQLSGDEPPEALSQLGQSAFKGLRPAGLQNQVSAASPAELFGLYPSRPSAPAYLLDAYQPGQYGGTGQVVDWNLAVGLAAHHPILLAGGLTPANVTEAVRHVNPWGVDVASGVESSPGRKEFEKMRRFVQAAKSGE
jgi:phosphoribosylanthranilate isomerase